MADNLHKAFVHLPDTTSGAPTMYYVPSIILGAVDVTLTGLGPREWGCHSDGWSGKVYPRRGYLSGSLNATGHRSSEQLEEQRV